MRNTKMIAIMIMFALLSFPVMAVSEDTELIIEGVLLIVAGLFLYFLMGIPLLLGLSVYGILKLITVLAHFVSSLSIFGGV